jgi:hypothetical protein
VPSGAVISQPSTTLADEDFSSWKSKADGVFMGKSSVGAGAHFDELDVGRAAHAVIGQRDGQLVGVEADLDEELVAGGDRGAGSGRRVRVDGDARAVDLVGAEGVEAR